jgi:hypothetical protein
MTDFDDDVRGNISFFQSAPHYQKKKPYQSITDSYDQYRKKHEESTDKTDARHKAHLDTHCLHSIKLSKQKSLKYWKMLF